MMVVSTISLLFVAPVVAQQEVSPDRFETVAVQNGQHATQATKKNTAYASAKKHTAKVRHSNSAGRQMASSKSTSTYTEIASK
jgi:hypothetical protein